VNDSFRNAARTPARILVDEHIPYDGVEEGDAEEMKALIADKLALGSLQRIGRNVAPPFGMFKQELHHVVSLKNVSEGAGSQAIHGASAPPSDSFGAIEPPRCERADGLPRCKTTGCIISTRSNTVNP